MLVCLNFRQLWMFVSNFTDLDHNKLRKLYKGASKRREEEKERNEVGHYLSAVSL